MILSLGLLRNDVFPEINVRPHDENDFFRIIQESVFYSEIPLPVEGCYSVDEFGNEHITINSNLAGLEKLRTQLHESVHKILDYPIDNQLLVLFRSLKTLHDKRDIIAEVLSLVLIFPFTELEQYFATNELRPELQPYLVERLQILDDHGI